MLFLFFIWSRLKQLFIDTNDIPTVSWKHGYNTETLCSMIHTDFLPEGFLYLGHIK